MLLVGRNICPITTKGKGIAMIAKNLPSLDKLDKLFLYNPENGYLLRKVGDCFKITARPHNKTGYIWITVYGVTYAAHRLCWKIYNKKDIPNDMEIDHINGITYDNRILNLRTVTMSQNMRNKKLYSSSTSGVSGVSFRSDTKKWRAQINIDGKNIKLGSFGKKSDAIAARLNAQEKYGFHENHGAR